MTKLRPNVILTNVNITLPLEERDLQIESQSKIEKLKLKAICNNMDGPGGDYAK